MSKSDFIGYVGPPELHDGWITSVKQTDNHATVLVRTSDTKYFALEFLEVTEIKANRAEGMLLYALTELTTTTPYRRFIFVNWHEDNDASLEIVAQDFRVLSPVEPT